MARNHTVRLVWVVAVLGMLLAGAASVSAFSFGKYEKAKANGSVVTIPIAKVADGKAHFYKFEDGGREITFFMVKAADGSVKTAFDACDSCYKFKKGYEQQGDKMHCNNCNKNFPIDRLGPNATGGCNPGYLPHQVNGNNIAIRVDDLKGGMHYF